MDSTTNGKTTPNRQHPTADRVRANTPPEVNEGIDRDIQMRIQFYSTQDKATTSRRLQDLDREWDIEQVLEAQFASLSLTGLLFGAVSGRKWYLLPLLASGFMLQHAVQGWCPPVGVLRRLGIRTRREIDEERYALKALRGDFEPVKSGEKGNPDQSRHAVEAVRS
jgi:hypothetical protein